MKKSQATKARVIAHLAQRRREDRRRQDLAYERQEQRQLDQEATLWANKNYSSLLQEIERKAGNGGKVAYITLGIVACGQSMYCGGESEHVLKSKERSVARLYQKDGFRVVGTNYSFDGCRFDNCDAYAGEPVPHYKTELIVRW